MKVGTDGVLLGAWAHGGSCILDIGTGTGVIALMMAQRFPDAQVTAIDIDDGAVRQAAANVAQSPFDLRIKVTQASLQKHEGQYEAIVCNPPFFIDSMQAPDRQRNMARHATTLTYAELSVVVPFDYRKRMEDEATFVGFFPSRVCAVRTVAGKPARRYMLAFRKHPCERSFYVITIGDETYQQLTGDFYL